MPRLILMCIALFLASPASADTCPPFFRFVDFGLIDNSGALLRGGPLLRGESFEGATLIALKQTKCKAVRDLARDGHGNPIPVVSDVIYDVKKVSVELTRLRVSVVEDARIVANKNAGLHRERLGRFETVQSQNALCAIATEARELSCQVTSPFKTPAPLVVYCDLEFCRMPVLAMDTRIVVSAIWAIDDGFWRDPDAAGAVVFAKIRDIHAFLEPLSSGF